MANNKRKYKRFLRGTKVFTSCISTTLVLLLLGTVVFFVTLAHSLSRSIKENFTITLLLNDDLSEKQIKEVQTKLKVFPCSKQVDFISKQKALEEQTKALGMDPSVFVENPIPASFEIRLKAEYANNDSLEKFIPMLEKENVFLEISYPEHLMENLNDNIRKISFVMLIVALLLMLVSIELINNTIRWWVRERRFMIQTMTLVGASWSYIRHPFLVKAFWIGFISSLLASATLLGGVYMIIEYEPKMQSLITYEMLAITVGVTFAAGIILTLLCAHLSVNSNLNLSYNKLYRY